MLRKTIFLGFAATLVLLATYSLAHAWGCHYSYHYGGYGGSSYRYGYHYGGYGGYGGYHYGGVHYRGYPGYGGAYGYHYGGYGGADAYRYGYYRRW